MLSASAIWASSVLLNVPTSVILIRRIVGLPVREQFAGLAAPLSAAAIMVVALTIARRWVLPESSPVTTLALLLPLGAVIYAGALFAISPALVKRLSRMVLELRPGAASS